jgi:hypothetical protein
MPEIECDRTIQISDEELESWDTFIPIERENYGYAGKKYNVKLRDVMETCVSLYNQLQTTISELKHLQEYGKYFVFKGGVKQICVMQVLADAKRPCSLDFIVKTLSNVSEYTQNYTSRSKTNIRTTLKLLMELRLVTRIERGLYGLSSKGQDFLKRNIQGYA